jgi:hypothetical protein
MSNNGVGLSALVWWIAWRKRGSCHFVRVTICALTGDCVKDMGIAQCGFQEKYCRVSRMGAIIMPILQCLADFLSRWSPQALLYKRNDGDPHFLCTICGGSSSFGDYQPCPSRLHTPASWLRVRLGNFFAVQGGKGLEERITFEI